MSQASIESQPDLLLLLLKRWRVLLVAGGAGLAVSIAYALLAPPWYEARLSAVPSQSGSGSVAARLAGQLPVFSALGSSDPDAQRIHSVLTSTSVADQVIAKFDLQKRYGAKHLEAARRELWSHCKTTVDRTSHLVELMCEDKDPEYARAIVEYFGETGNRTFGRITSSSAREERRFLEKQVESTKRELDEASRKLRDFRQKHRVIDLEEQGKAVVSAMASIKGSIISKQIELSYLGDYSSPREADVQRLKQQISVLEGKLDQLENTKGHTPAKPADPQVAHAPNDEDSQFFPNAMSVPTLRFELEQLYREQLVQETVYSLLVQRFEMAKVDEARDTSSFQILDQPTLPTERVRPKRRKIAAFGLAGGLAGGATWILVPVWWRRRRNASASRDREPE